MNQFVDSSDEEADDTAEVEDTIGPAPALPPPGYRYATEPPPLATDADLVALVGRHIVHAFDAVHIKGWFVGKVVARGVSNRRDLERAPTANMVVNYDKKVTKNPSLHGRVASTLTLAKYGMKEWWVLLERV